MVVQLKSGMTLSYFSQKQANENSDLTELSRYRLKTALNTGIKKKSYS